MNHDIRCLPSTLRIVLENKVVITWNRDHIRWDRPLQNVLTWCLGLNVRRLGIGIRKAHTSKYVLFLLIWSLFYMQNGWQKDSEKIVCQSWKLDINKHTHKRSTLCLQETHRCKLEFKVIKACNKRLLIVDGLCEWGLKSNITTTHTNKRSNETKSPFWPFFGSATKSHIIIVPVTDE
jgi:hypothetical protein